MPTIRIDDEVYEWLKSQAIPFEDNPNSVLRRVAGLATRALGSTEAVTSENEDSTGGEEAVTTRVNGNRLSREYGLQIKQSRYSETGTFYENLSRFPGALWDKYGYKIFHTQEDYLTSPYLQVGKKLNVPNGGISSIPGYKHIR